MADQRLNSRRGFLQGVAGGVGTGVMAAGGARAAAGPMPNILYLHSHDSGRCLQPYGHAFPC